MSTSSPHNKATVFDSARASPLPPPKLLGLMTPTWGYSLPHMRRTPDLNFCHPSRDKQWGGLLLVSGRIGIYLSSFTSGDDGAIWLHLDRLTGSSPSCVLSGRWPENAGGAGSAGQRLAFFFVSIVFVYSVKEYANPYQLGCITPGLFRHYRCDV